MMDNQKRQKARQGQLGGMLTRRMITENRISNNIMEFNQATVIKDFKNMEVSTNYHTQVSVSKYILSSPREDNSLLSFTASGGLP
jgi:hypothetical protein